MRNGRFHAESGLVCVADPHGGGLVGAGIGVAIVPTTARNLRPRGVHFLEITDRPEPMQVALAWLRGKKDIPAVRSFRDVTLQVVRHLAGRSR